MQILVRNIDRKFSQEEIIREIQKHGRVTTFDLVMDTKTGASKGFGFAEMPNMDEAAKAIKEMNGLRMGGSTLRVKRAANSSISKKKH